MRTCSWFRTTCTHTLLEKTEFQFRALSPAAAAAHLPWFPHHRAISSRRGSAAGVTWPFTVTTLVRSPVQDVQAEVRACSCQVMKQRGLDEWTLARTYCLEVVFEPILKSEIHRYFCIVVHKKPKFSVHLCVCLQIILHVKHQTDTPGTHRDLF